MCSGRFLKQGVLACWLLCGLGLAGSTPAQEQPQARGPELGGPTGSAEDRPSASETDSSPRGSDPDDRGRPSPVGRLLLRWLGIPVDPLPEQPDEPRRSRTDPFQTTRAMREAARVQPPETAAQGRRTPLPELTLRGVAQGAQRPAVAILSVGGPETVVVREGETVGLPAGGPAVELRVVKITRGAVHVQVGGSEQTLVVR